MSDTKTVQIAPAAALTESVALNEFYRNRVLLLANSLHEMMEVVTAQKAEIERLKEFEPQAAEGEEATQSPGASITTPPNK